MKKFIKDSLREAKVTYLKAICEIESANTMAEVQRILDDYDVDSGLCWHMSYRHRVAPATYGWYEIIHNEMIKSGKDESYRYDQPRYATDKQGVIDLLKWRVMLIYRILEPKKIQNYTKLIFVSEFIDADDGELICENIRKMWSSEGKGYWYVANAGDCDGGDTIMQWFGDDAGENGYVAALNARI